jgi:hypothetical protein
VSKPKANNPAKVILLQCIEVCGHCRQRLGTPHLPECQYVSSELQWWMTDNKKEGPDAKKRVDTRRGR